ncbi:PPC domain-containing protein [Phormidium yuhuli AB48]|uniref:PPC domain-containing protein n=1 Tax=Phormidium yuhuli AB48 TaxID=2940671 RepID=A0ABY5ASS2_9CYAN|nr:PPC domain-containing protein [Phormidium yuhuli]USR91915.1 PPC domain-containing protein [Phormidium yuhuli AB48]
MKSKPVSRLTRHLVTVPLITLSWVMTAEAIESQKNLYNPTRLPPNGEVSGVLSENDIPTGQGGFAHDYVVELEAGDQITVDVTSDSFDTIVSLLTPDGLTIGENDDGPDGTTNSLLFMRIQRSGTYIIRVRAFGAGGTGPFNLRLTRLRPM